MCKQPGQLHQCGPSPKSPRPWDLCKNVRAVGHRRAVDDTACMGLPCSGVFFFFFLTPTATVFFFTFGVVLEALGGISCPSRDLGLLKGISAVWLGCGAIPLAGDRRDEEKRAASAAKSSVLKTTRLVAQPNSLERGGPATASGESSAVPEPGSSAKCHFKGF